MNRNDSTTSDRDQWDHPGPVDPFLRERRWERIEARLEAAEYWLRDQGSIVRKRADGRACWAVRFVVREGERSRHKSIYLTTQDPEILRRARVLLARYRERGDERRQLMQLISAAFRTPRCARRAARRRR